MVKEGDLASLSEESVNKDARSERSFDRRSAEGSERRRPGSSTNVAEAQDEEREQMGQEESGETQLLRQELEKIKVASPTLPEPVEVFDPSDFPDSYKQNTNKEKLVLAYAENFRKQYIHLYREQNRKPLLLNPVNELQVEKFVSTTIQPTELPYKELYEWQGAAEFVADYLQFVPLRPAHELPLQLLAPMTVLKLQRGNCFEYSTLLVSLLIGVGYDAYVVSGYATKETCLMDETREVCPMLKPVAEVKREEAKPSANKYAVRQPKDLRSRFDMKQEAKRLKQIADEDQRLRELDEERLLLLDQPPEDDLYGLRTHSWVLVLDGKREVPEPFFIEPLTGQPHPIDSPKYLGVESVWNHRNYWVNMQDCSEGVKNMRYDLGDCALWEFMFPSNDKPQLLMQNGDDDEQDPENEDDIERHLDIPHSWTLPIHLSPRDFQMRCPQGRKVRLYKKARLEKFAPYVMRDGLVCRLSVYEDTELTRLIAVKELYENRMDKLYERYFNYKTEWITEKFGPGRLKNIKEHNYKTTAGLMPEGERVMTFYDNARVDGLIRRTETVMEMTEEFTNRDDFLVYRHVEYGIRQKKFGPAAENSVRPIEKLIERYNRNVDKDANDDIHEVTFNMAEEKIYVTYHRENSKISATNREFIKPAPTDDKGTSGIVWNVDNHTAYLSDANKTEKKKVDIYQMMMDLLQMEQRCIETVRSSEREIQEILDDRLHEEATSELSISIYDTLRNDKAKKHREMLEKLELEAKLQSEEKELDYLEPFLRQMNLEPSSAKLTSQQALKLKQDCLANLKQRLIDQANLIQCRFEKETQELQKKQAWYQQNQVSMQKADEQQYLSYCNDAMFRIHILEQRLQRHKDLAPHKYMALEQKIRSDPRLAEFF